MNSAAKRIEDLERERSILANKADNKSLADQGQKLNVQKAAQEIQNVTDIQLIQMEKTIDNYKKENESMETKYCFCLNFLYFLPMLFPSIHLNVECMALISAKTRPIGKCNLAHGSTFRTPK